MLPESFSFLRERPLEPDTDNSGVGIRDKSLRRPYPVKGMRFFIFMRLKINGKAVDNVKSATVMELLDELNVHSSRVAVEVNLAIVRKADYGSFALRDGDTVEIVNFVGGG